MKVVWSRRAIQHLTALREYIARDSERSAALVAKRILGAVDLLEAQPEMAGQVGWWVRANWWFRRRPT